jgi:Lrp/AsnC family transcriptional regulator
MQANLDALDRAILSYLQQDAQAKLKDISLAINLSLTPTHERIKRLEAEGYIKQYVTLLDAQKLGLGLVVHCQVTLEKQTRDSFAEFEAAIVQFPEVMSCSLVSGNFDYYIKLVTRDVDSYHRFYQEKLAVLPMVARISSLFVMNEVKSTTALPI